jgi:hypothetical protein
VLGRAAFTRGDLEQDVLAVAFDALCCASTVGHAVPGYVDRLASRLGGGVMAPAPDAVERERRQLVTRRLSRELEAAMERDQLVEDRGRLERMLDEAIDRLDLRRLRDCSPPQRVDAYGIAERLREVRGDITSARTRDALGAAEARARDPVGRAGELHLQIEREQAVRRQAGARVALYQRSRSPELAPARSMANLIAALLPGAHGAALDTLDGQARQLEVTRPVSEEERRRSTESLARKEVRNAQLLNPGWTP